MQIEQFALIAQNYAVRVPDLSEKHLAGFTAPCFREPLDAPEAALESFLIAGRRMIRQHVAAIPANSCGHFILSRARDLLDVARASNHLRPER